MAYSFRENTESKKDLTKDCSSNYTPITVTKEVDNPFFEAPLKYEEPVEQGKEEYKVDVMNLIGKRNNQKILASPDLALTKKGVNRRASAAHRILGRYASQDISHLGSDNLLKQEPTEVIEANKSKALQSTSNFPIEINANNISLKEERRVNAEVSQENIQNHPKEDVEMAPEIYHSPRGSAVCCGWKGVNGMCVIM